MKKKELLKHIAAETGLAQSRIDEVLIVLQEVVVKELKEVGESQIHGLATFKVKDKPQREGRNPGTGESIVIAAKRVVTAKCTTIQTAVTK